MKKISVIVPVHNGAATIERCLNSIVSQAVSDLELMIIDDASTDESRQIVEAWILRHTHTEDDIRYICQDQLMGVSSIRDLGVYNATGKYVMFVNQADTLAPYVIEEYLREAEKNQVDIVVGGYEENDKNGETISSVMLEDAEFSKFRNMHSYAHLYRREFLMDNRILFTQTKSGKQIPQAEAYFTMIAYSATKLVQIVQNTGYKHTRLAVEHGAVSAKHHPLGFLTESYQDLAFGSFRNKEEVEYFYIRHIVLFLEDAAPFSNKKMMKKLYKRLIKWLDHQYPTWRRSRFRYTQMPDGEDWEIHKRVRNFMILDTLKIQKFLLTRQGKK